MRELYSNPVAAGVDAFSKVAGTFNQIEDSKMRRELMAQQTADRRIRNERQTKLESREDQLWDEREQTKHGKDTLNTLSSVYDKAQRAKISGTPLNVSDLSDDEVQSVVKMADYKGFFDKDGKVDPTKLESVKTLTSAMQSPEIQEAMKQKGKVSIPLDLPKNKKLGDAVSSIWGNEINAGVDAAGNKAEKRPKVAYMDFSTDIPTLTFGLEVKPPKSGVGNLVPLKGYEKDVYNIPEDPKPAGQLERGNIDLSQRKVAINDDGSISTVLSRSFNIDGKEVLLPLVSDSGNIVSDKEAIDNFKKTGKHLGMFDSPEAATRYAEKLHNSEIWKPSIDYYSQDSYMAPMTFGRNGDPKAPIQQIPAPILAMQLNSMDQLGGWVNQLEAKWGSTESSKRIQAMRKNDAAVKAYEAAGGDVKKFAKSMMDQGMAVEDIKKYSELLTKTTPKMSSQAGKQMADREELVKTYGEGSAEVKKFDSATDSKGKPKEGEIRKYDDAGTTITEEFKDGKWVKKAKSPKFKPDGGEKLKAIAESSESPAVMKTAQDKIRKNQKLDSYKAIEDSKTEIITTIQKAGKSSIAVEALKKMGVSEEDAKDEVKRYIKKMNKKAK